MRIINDDCLNALPTLESDSVDSIVTDPPYELGFMGKHWDNTGIAYNVKMWQECLRVLKPGGHLLAFGGTRTYHRMACAIEDAGFEVRDMIEYVYGSGFPKSLNIFKALTKECKCGNMDVYENRIQLQPEMGEEETEYYLRFMRESDIPSQVNTNEKCREILLEGMQEQSTSEPQSQTAGHDRSGKPSVERRNNIQETEGQLQGGEVREMPEGVLGHGTQGRLCNGAQTSNGNQTWQAVEQDRGCASSRPRSKQQQYNKPCPFCKQYGAQVIRAFGFGSNLKPAHEPICLARKPLSEKTIAENVLKHGTGGINIDACRVGCIGESTSRSLGKSAYQKGGGIVNGGVQGSHEVENEYGGGHTAGRFPANLIHDGSDEVKECFPETKTGDRKPCIQSANKIRFNSCSFNTGSHQGDSGNASRYFKSIIYTSKTCPSERKEVNNNHATVKPVKLMEYLVTMITPPNGVVLDPFLGSGTTAIACRNMGFDCIGIEKEAEYMGIINRRLEHALDNLEEPEPSLFEVKNDSNPS